MCSELKRMGNKLSWLTPRYFLGTPQEELKEENLKAG
jgi:hypothetical protein